MIMLLLVVLVVTLLGVKSLSPPHLKASLSPQATALADRLPQTQEVKFDPRLLKSMAVLKHEGCSSPNLWGGAEPNN